MDAQDVDVRISQDDVEALVRLAGLNVSEERLPNVTAELESALRAARALDPAVGRAPVPGGVPFDPSWSRQRGRTES